MTVLEVRDVTKHFGSLAAVRRASLSVEKGELRAVIGPNGAGKTTFFNMISGFFRPSSGSILFDGRDITTLPAHKRVALGMARTFQITEIFPALSVFENVRVAAEAAAGYSHRVWVPASGMKNAHASVEHVLRLVGLEEKACQAGWRTRARRPASGRNRHGPRCPPASPSP